MTLLVIAADGNKPWAVCEQAVVGVASGVPAVSPTLSLGLLHPGRAPAVLVDTLTEEYRTRPPFTGVAAIIRIINKPELHHTYGTSAFLDTCQRDWL